MEKIRTAGTLGGEEIRGAHNVVTLQTWSCVLVGGGMGEVRHRQGQSWG